MPDSDPVTTATRCLSVMGGGYPTSADLIRGEARGGDAVLDLEAGADAGALKTSRTGGLGYPIAELAAARRHAAGPHDDAEPAGQVGAAPVAAALHQRQQAHSVRWAGSVMTPRSHPSRTGSGTDRA
jgi:glutamate carboxypeptidase